MRAPVLALAPIAGVCALAACVSASGEAAGRRAEATEEAPPIRYSRAEEWITLSDFRHVTAVAANESGAYFGTTAGVERFDTLRASWLSPITSADGLPDPLVTALGAEPAGGDLWVGTRRGLVRVPAFTGEVERVWGPPRATVDAIGFVPGEGEIWTRVAGRWWVGRIGSSALERAAGPPPESLVGSVAAADLDPAAIPWLDPLWVRSPAVPDRLFRLTRVDRDLRRDWYAGTWGDNGRRWGAGVAEWEPLYFGLAGPAGGPVVPVAGGWWFVPGTGDRSGAAARLAIADRFLRADVGVGDPAPLSLARASRDLQRWTYVTPSLQPGLATAVAGTGVGVGDTVYLGTDAGLVRGVEESWRSWGLTHDPALGGVHALAVDGPRLWLGTDAGLLAWDRAGERVVERRLRGRRVTAIAVAADALFIGTDTGLWIGLRDAAGEAEGPTGAPPDSLHRAATRGREIRSLAQRDTLLVAATDYGLEAFDRRSGEWRIVPATDGRLDGAALVVALDESQVWIGTPNGLVRWRLGTGEWRRYTMEDGLAGVPIRHLLAGENAVWASTPRGVSRFAWRSAEGDR